MILAGIMVGGVKCGRPQLPGIYTRVQKFVKWIEDIVKAPGEFRHKREVNNEDNNKKPSEDKYQVVRDYVQARVDTIPHSML